MIKKILSMMVITVLLSGCRQVTTSNIDNSQPSQNEELIEQEGLKEKKVIELTFSPVPIEELSKEQPKTNWIKIKSVPFGKLQEQEITLHLYTDKENKEPYDEGDIYAFLNFKEDVYFIGNVSPSYGLDDVKVEVINQPIKNGQKEIYLVGRVGTQFTGGRGIGYEVKENKWIQFSTVGKPNLVDLDSDNNAELVGIFTGVHLQPPNIYIFRLKSDVLEMANVVEATGIRNGFVRLDQVDGRLLFNIGILSDDSRQHLFKFGNDKLIQVE